jgi:hypothetical protein
MDTMKNPESKFHPENHARVAIFVVAAVASVALSMMTWRRAALDNTRVWSVWEQSNIESSAEAAVIPPELMPKPSDHQAAAAVASPTPNDVAKTKQVRGKSPEPLRDYSRARNALLRVFAASIDTARHH